MEVGDWATLGKDAQRLRAAVFVEEQRIPKELESDAADQHAVHAVAFNRLGWCVATGRMLPAEAGRVKVGRMAVDRVLRGGQLGRQVLEALADAARAQGDQALVLHAQRSAEGFYDRLGFTRQGDPYEEAGIPHVTMGRSLR